MAFAFSATHCVPQYLLPISTQFYGASLHPEHLFFVTELMAGGFARV